MSSATELQIIGYGNPQRRDDGIGIYIARRLRSVLKGNDGVRIRTCRQLDPSMVADLRETERILFVDATFKTLRGGWQLHRIFSEPERLPFTTHHFPPTAILAILQLDCRRRPLSWLLTVQGDDFGYGYGLSGQAVQRANTAISAAYRWVKENSRPDAGLQNHLPKTTGDNHGHNSRYPRY